MRKGTLICFAIGQIIQSVSRNFTIDKKGKWLKTRSLRWLNLECHKNKSIFKVTVHTWGMELGKQLFVMHCLSITESLKCFRTFEEKESWSK